MYAVSQAYRTALTAPVRTERITGQLTLRDGGVLDFTQADLVSGTLTLDDQCVTEQELNFGAAFLGQASLRLYTDLDRYRLYDAKLTLTYGLQLDDGSWYDLPLGVYYVAEAERTNRWISLKAYDALVLLDRDFTGEMLQGNLPELLRLSAERCGLSLGQTTAELGKLCNANEAFSLDPHDYGTYRDCVMALAQVAGCFAAADRQGRLVLRQFAAEACRSIGPSERMSATVADFECCYAALTVRSGDYEYTAVSSDEMTGLELRMEDASLFATGTEIRGNAMVEALYTKVLSGIRYTPATVALPGDPALDCGDRLTLTGVGGKTEASAEMLVTHRVWKFRGRCTVQGVGRNPRLSGTKSRVVTELHKLQSQAAANQMVFYLFSNPEALTISDTRSAAVKIRFVTTQDTSAMFFAQLPLHTVSTAAPVTLTVTYLYNGFEVAMPVLRQTLAESDHLLALFYPIAEVAGNTANDFEVQLEANGGTVHIEANAIRAVITGQGMAGASTWDGTLQGSDTLPTPMIVQPQRLTLPQLRVQCNAGTDDPLGGSGFRNVLPDPVIGTVPGIHLNGVREEIVINPETTDL